jgi:DNA-binding MarR family transcriptional regulator
VLARLEVRGFLARKPAPEDRRRAVLTLTAAGKRLDNTQAGTVEAAVRRALARMSDTEIAATRRVIGEVARELGGDGEI